MMTSGGISMEKLVQTSEHELTHFLNAHYFETTNEKTNATRMEAWKKIVTPQHHHTTGKQEDIESYLNISVSSHVRRFTRTTCRTVLGSLDEVVKAIAADSTPAYERLELELVGPKLLAKAKVVHALKPRTKESPQVYVGLKKVSYHSSLRLTRPIQQEKYTLIESIGHGINLKGKRFVYKMLRSFSFSSMEKDKESLNSSNANGLLHCMMLIVTETKVPGILEMNVWMDIDIQLELKSFSFLHDSFTLTMRYRELIESFVAQEESRKTSHSLVWIPSLIKARRRLCQVCERPRLRGRLLFLRDHQRCHLCGTFVCHFCITKKNKLCKSCLDHKAIYHHHHHHHHLTTTRKIPAKSSSFSNLNLRASTLSAASTFSNQKIENWSFQSDKRRSMPSLVIKTTPADLQRTSSSSFLSYDQQEKERNTYSLCHQYLHAYSQEVYEEEQKEEQQQQKEEQQQQEEEQEEEDCSYDPSMFVSNTSTLWNSQNKKKKIILFDNEELLESFHSPSVYYCSTKKNQEEEEEEEEEENAKDLKDPSSRILLLEDELMDRLLRGHRRSTTSTTTTTTSSSSFETTTRTTIAAI